MSTNTTDSQKVAQFVEELNGFTVEAENALNHIENGAESTAQDFHSFSERMIAIRGSSDQLGLANISKIAGLGEEIAIKAESTTSRNQIRKCMSCLWDTLTTVRYMLQHPDESTNEEQEILTHRLESVLKQLGGARETVSEDEIEALLNKTAP